METKRKIVMLILTITITTFMLNTTITQVKSAIPAEPHDANAMWIEPSVVNVTGFSTGYKFNVTVWINLTEQCAGWQFYLLYDKSLLNVTRCGFTAGDKSDFFKDIITLSFAPTFGVENGTHDYVMQGESWLMGDFRGPGYGSLSWVELEVMAEPPEGQEIVTTLDISTYHHPPNSKTYALDTSNTEISLNVYDCTYTFGSSTAPPPPPEEAKIYVDPHEIIDPTLLPSSTFSINITVDDVIELHVCEFNLTYDSVVVSWTGMTALKVQDQTPTVKSMIDDEGGFVWVKLRYPTAFSTNTSIPLLTIDFHVNSLGATPLDLHDTQLLNSESQPIEHEAIDGFFCTLIRDVAITNVATSRNWAYQGWEVNITVVVKNKGTMNETFEVGTYYDSNLIERINVTNLASDEERDITFLWNTTSVAEGNYTIKAEAEILPYEVNIDDNALTDGTVWIMTKIHDIALTDLISPDKAYQGWEVNITVVVKNKGNFTETFPVQVFIDNDLFGNMTIADLLPGNETTVTFVWNTENVPPCTNYTISAEASAVPYELNITDNRLTNGKIKIRYMGDIDGNGFVDIKDILAIADSFGSYPSSPRWNPDFDLDQNGFIDIKDIFMIAINYGQGCP